MAFFENEAEPLQKRIKAKLRVPPPIPDTGWLPPKIFPNLSDACFITHDVETREYDWDHGPGWSRGQAEIVGHSISAYWRNGEEFTAYYPTRHTVEPEYNLDHAQVTNYMRDQLQTPHIPKGYANAYFDIGNSTDDNIFVQGEIHDIQFSEALLTEDDDVDLDALGEKYLGSSKDTSAMYKWCSEAYGGEPNGSQRGNIYRTSPRLAGPYAEEDSRMIRPVLEKQWPRMQSEGLLDLYRMECDLVVLLVRMRMQGAQIDVSYAEALYGEITASIDIQVKEVKFLTGIQIADSAASGDIARVFDKVGIPYRTTPITKKPSIVDEDLATLDHPVARLCHAIRQLDKIRGTFVRNGLLEAHVNGVIHGEFNPLRLTGGNYGKKGARTGRFSSAHPNLQNIPVRSELGQRVRKAYIPFAHHKDFLEMDFSQYEYRILAHYAVGPGSDALRMRYRGDPNTDYHDSTMDMIKNAPGGTYNRWEASGLDYNKIRKRVKTVNFSLMNAMGEAVLSSELGINRSEAKELLDVYHSANPYIKATLKATELEAQKLGYITTILGRRRRFNMWEPKPIWDEKSQSFLKSAPLKYGHAIREYGTMIQRARCHIALNSRTQGTNADGMKRSMMLAHKAGVFDVTGVPMLTVHDSLGFSRKDDSPLQIEAYRELQHIMETALPLNVPIRVDTATGPNWGDLH
jgi:DNA polymerase I-like protein with 3'-5' exonuclease and polymerase domains